MERGTKIMNNYELHSRAQELAASHIPYNLARRLLALEEELQEARREVGQSQQARGEIRYTNDGAMAECPCCGCLDVGAAGNVAHCYGCGLSITKASHKEVLAAWNRRTGPPAPAAVPDGMRHVFEEMHPLMGLVSWSDFDDSYTALTDSGLDLAEDRTLQFHAWRLAWTLRENEAVGHLDEDGEGLYARVTHDDVARCNAKVGDPVYLRSAYPDPEDPK